jgi:glycosyltransferase involved in cell wall biosynthesis
MTIPAARPRKLIFVNRFFDPDESATSQLLTDLARALAGRGYDVHIVCCRQLYTDPAARLARFEILAGVRVHRVATTRFGRAGLVGRAVDYASFYLAAGWRLLRLLHRGDVLVVKTDPPLLSLLGVIVTGCKSAALITWQQDIFPEIASHLGSNPLPARLDAGLRRLRDWSLRRARCNVVISDRMFEYLRARGIAAERLCVIENWADASAIQPKRAEDSGLRAEWGLADRFVVGYSGNLGRAHEYATLLAAALLLREDPTIRFLMIGDGAKMQSLRRAVLDAELTNFVFQPYQPRALLSDSLSAADVHLISLLPALEGLIMPSKLYGVLAAGRPVVFIGDSDGAISRVIGGVGCGFSVGVGDGTRLVHLIRTLQGDPALCCAMGEHAREVLERRYAAEIAVARWITVLNSCTS